MKLYDNNYLSKNERRLGHLLEKYSDDGLGNLIGYFSIDWTYESPIYYKKVLNDIGEEERVFYFLSLDEDSSGEELISPFDDNELKYFFSSNFMLNKVYFENILNDYLAVYSSSIYDGMDFYLIGRGKTKEEAVSELIKNYLILLDVKPNDFKK